MYRTVRLLEEKGILERRDFGGGRARYEPTEHARGPWDPRALHGGAPAALIARAFERLEPGALVDFDLILGARPIATMARVISCAEEASGRHRVELGFVAMAQLDRDTLADFLQAVGRDVLRVREPRR